MANPPPGHWVSDNDSDSDRGVFDVKDEVVVNTGECKYERSPKDRKPLTYGEDEPVCSVVVGPPRDQTQFFMIRKSLTTSSSKFLKDKVKSGWFEENDSIELPQHTEATFKLYVEWLHRVRGLSRMSDTVGTSAEPHPAQFRLLASAFVLGEDLVDDEFKNFVIDALLKKIRGHHGDSFWEAAPDMIGIIYGGTSDGSQARRLMADIFAYGVDEKQMQGLMSQLPNAFHCDLTVAFAASRTAKSFRDMPLQRCEYHQH